MFGQAHRQLWRHKPSLVKSGGTIRNPKTATTGDNVCTDQLVSAQPGLVLQENGQPTRARIWGATIFVDRDAMARCVTMKGYHTDNGRYAKHTFKDDCTNKQQNSTFYKVGAHHQNGISEAKIKQLIGV